MDNFAEELGKVLLGDKKELTEEEELLYNNIVS